MSSPTSKPNGEGNTPPKPRPYLRSEDRRRQLLGAAAEIVHREGLERLTMAGLAAEAGVSRQLVYEHFADLQTLVTALLVFRFGEVDATIAQGVSDSQATGVDGALLVARLVLSLPAEERLVLRALLSRASIRGRELSDLARRLRGRMINRWSSTLSADGSPASQAGVWAIVNAMFGLGDLVDDGRITLDQALGQLSVLIAAALPGLQGAAGQASEPGESAA
jgi:AcrR family transcriptional regulator